MSWQQSIENFLFHPNVQVDALDFSFNLVLAVLLAWVLARFYTRFGEGLSNRKLFGRNFVIIAATTVLVISIVRSSLALSLGLIGALSIVRFRSAIKEPEELAYLFLTIAIGLGLGVGQRAFTVLGFATALAMMWLHHRGPEPSWDRNLHLSAGSRDLERVPMRRVVETLRRHCRSVDVGDLGGAQDPPDVSVRVDFEDLSQLESAVGELLAENRGLRVSFLDAGDARP